PTPVLLLPLDRHKPPVAAFHLGVAGAILKADPPGPDFARRWLLAVGLLEFGFDGPGARQLLEEGLRHTPEDLELLLARGSLEEAESALPPGTRRDPPLGSLAPSTANPPAPHDPRPPL